MEVSSWRRTVVKCMRLAFLPALSRWRDELCRLSDDSRSFYTFAVLIRLTSNVIMSHHTYGARLAPLCLSHKHSTAHPMILALCISGLYQVSPAAISYRKIVR